MTDKAEKVLTRYRVWDDKWRAAPDGEWVDADSAAELITAQAAEIERLTQEAQGWAQEARTHKATVHEIYQLVTGATGEPGNWHGAEPVRTKLASQAAEIERLREQLRPSAPFTDEDGCIHVRETPTHVCGLTGYNRMIDPPCPACEEPEAGDTP